MEWHTLKIIAMQGWHSHQIEMTLEVFWSHLKSYEQICALRLYDTQLLFKFMHSEQKVQKIMSNKQWHERRSTYHLPLPCTQSLSLSLYCIDMYCSNVEQKNSNSNIT